MWIKLMVEYKEIALTEREIKEAEGAAQNNAFDKMPSFLVELFIRLKIKTMRKSAMNIRLPDVEIRNKIVKTEHCVNADKGDVSIYFYRRENMQKQAPLMYFIHGGGFVGGTYLANENFCKRLADMYDVVCASAEYHLAPEVRFPYALRECELGLLALLENAETSRFINKNQVYVAGDSAGGNLAATTALSLKNRRNFTPAGQILYYPVTEMKEMSTNSYARPGPENSRMLKMLKITRKLYASKKSDYGNFYFSPLLSTKQDDPNPTPALILLAERDGLLDDGILYAKHLASLGGEARCVVYKGAFHSFLNGLGDSLIADDSFSEVASFMGLLHASDLQGGFPK